MLITPLTLRAFTLAQEAHSGQRDKGGHPYIEHVMFVANHVSGELATVVALLHDVLEDTDMTTVDMEKSGIPARAIQSVSLLTRKPLEDYFAYIERIKSDPVAVEVKLADLQHNSDLSRILYPSEYDKRRREKYQRAIRALSDKTRIRQD